MIDIPQQSQNKFKQSIHIWPAIRLVWQGAPGWTALRIVLILVQGVLPLGLLFITKFIIDTLTASLAAGAAVTDYSQTLVNLLSLMGLIILVQTSCGALSEFVDTAQSRRVMDHMYSILHAKSLEVDLEYYENPEYHNTLQRAQKEAAYRPNLVLENLVTLAEYGIALITMAGLLLSLHWGILIGLFISTIPAIRVKLKYASELYLWHRKRTETERQAKYFSKILTGSRFAKEIRLFDLGQLFSRRFDNLRQRLYREKLNIAARRGVSNWLAQLFASSFTFGAYGFIVFQTFQGKLQLGDLVIYYQAVKRGQRALKGIFRRLSKLYKDNLFLENLYEFLDLEPKLISPSSPEAIPLPIKRGIVFEDVQFHYNSSTRQAIKGVDLTIRPGETIALVGENGSGKTTLIKLLCRLYDPSAGRITIDGIDIQQFDITDLRRQISVTFQDYVKYLLTAKENIWLGNVELDPNDDSITKAAFRSGAEAVIQSLPKDYDTVLGNKFYEGEELSIGQWQKIALARAFVRKSQVLVLDEPTSALDPKAEYEVFKKFKELIQDQAAILITHRLSTVKMVDRIYVLDRGKIVEQGSHEELMHLHGTYADLFETQAQNYR